jgi:hypothetical protein
MNVVLSAIIVISTLLLLSKLHQSYLSTFERQQETIQKLLRDRGPHNLSKKERPIVLPDYYTIVLGASFLFTFEAILSIMNPKRDTQPVFYQIFRHDLFIFCAFLDNLVFVYLLGPFSRYQFRKALSVSIVISCIYTAVLIESTPKVHCRWCGLRYPMPAIEIPYFIAFLVYLFVSVVACLRPLTLDPHVHGTHFVSFATRLRREFSPRPAARLWCAFLAATYGLAALGIHLVEHHQDATGYCVLATSSVCDSLCYAAMLFVVCVADSKLHHTWKLSSALNGALMPLMLDSPGRSSSFVTPSWGDGNANQAGARGLPIFVQELLGDVSVVLIPSDEVIPHDLLGHGGFGEVQSFLISCSMIISDWLLAPVSHQYMCSCYYSLSRYGKEFGKGQQ